MLSQGLESQLRCIHLSCDLQLGRVQHCAPLEEVHEPYLIQLGFLKRTQQGRVATQLAYRHFGLEPPPTTDQKQLF